MALDLGNFDNIEMLFPVDNFSLHVLCKKLKSKKRKLLFFFLKLPAASGTGSIGEDNVPNNNKACPLETNP